jgi:hypothetical protein
MHYLLSNLYVYFILLDAVSEYNATAAAKPEKHINRAGVH